MHFTLKTRVLALLVFLLVGIALLPASAQKKPHPKPQPKLPVTFVCKHCKIKMTVKTRAEWKKNCWVCGCKKPASACK